MPIMETWSCTTIDSNMLVARLQRPDDEEAWRLAEERYGPLVAAAARRMGLNASSALDARQEVMLAFVQAIRAGRFDRSRGRLRDLLFGIARRQICALRRREERHRQRFVQPGESGFLERVPAEDSLKKIWDEETVRAVRHQCVLEAQRHFSAKTYGIYCARVILHRPGAEVAEEFGTTPAAVHMAVHHVRAFLNEIYPEIEKAF